MTDCRKGQARYGKEYHGNIGSSSHDASSDHLDEVSCGEMLMIDGKRDMITAGIGTHPCQRVHGRNLGRYELRNYQGGHWRW